MMTIVTDTKASEQENYAAKELKNYLDYITSSSIPLKSLDSNQDSTPVLAVERAAEALGMIPLEDWGEDTFSIQTTAKGLGISGGKRGVIYGVYEFLEKLGCRFFTTTSERIPSIPDLELPVIEDTQTPVFEYRFHNYVDFTGHPSFAVKNRINGPIRMTEKMGGNLSYVWFVHSFNHIIDPEKWFDTHPEYFSLVDGKRLKERTQLCLTNPDVLRITIEKVREALKKRPNHRLISVSQNDWYNNCTCSDCKKIDEEEGSAAGSLIWFVNQVAEAIEPEFPDVIVDTLAYQYTRPAPKHIRPRKNVCVRLCSIESCFAHPLDQCDDEHRKVTRPDGTTSRFIQDLRDWAKVCDRVYIWDYTTCFSHYPMPYPNWNVLQPNMQSFAENNVKGVFEQACMAIGGSTDFNELRAYLLAKLMWNPDCDVELHKKEFMDHYYGEAAPYLNKYLKVQTDKVEKDNIHIGFNSQTNLAYLADDMLDLYEEIFNEAEKAANGNPILMVRVAKARLSIRWVRLKNDAMLKNKKDPAEIHRFFDDWKAHGLTRIEEWVSPETTHRALIENIWQGAHLYKNWWDEGGEEL